MTGSCRYFCIWGMRCRLGYGPSRPCPQIGAHVTCEIKDCYTHLHPLGLTGQVKA